jgi:hypothetical protein
MFSHKQRPTAAAIFTFFGGAAMLWVGAQMLKLIFFSNTATTMLGMAIGLLVWVLALLLLFYPQAHTVLGVFIIALSVFSFVGALGGLIVGSVLGIIGGALAIAWQPQPEKKVELTEEEAQVVQGELAGRGKSLPAAWALWLFTGLGGGHRYYTGHYWRAGLMSLFFAIAAGYRVLLIVRPQPKDIIMLVLALGVPLILIIWWLVDAFLLPMAVKDANFRLGILSLKQMHTEGAVVETEAESVGL